LVRVEVLENNPFPVPSSDSTQKVTCVLAASASCTFKLMSALPNFCSRTLGGGGCCGGVVRFATVSLQLGKTIATISFGA